MEGIEQRDVFDDISKMGNALPDRGGGRKPLLDKVWDSRVISLMYSRLR